VESACPRFAAFVLVGSAGLGAAAWTLLPFNLALSLVTTPSGGWWWRRGERTGHAATSQAARGRRRLRFARL